MYIEWIGGYDFALFLREFPSKKVAFRSEVGYILFSDQNGPVPTDPGQCPWPLLF